MHSTSVYLLNILEHNCNFYKVLVYSYRPCEIEVERYWRGIGR